MTDKLAMRDPIAATDRVVRLLGLIRFSHTLFALPFACLALLMATFVPLPDGSLVGVGWRQVLAVFLCMVFARSSAMAFNRLVDQRFDAANPRTANRHLPAGLLSRGEVRWFTILCSLGFIVSCGLFLPNQLPLVASVPVLFFLLGYSLAKRFTAAAHLWLGVALSLAPICVWVAIRGYPSLIEPSDWVAPLILAAAVAAWVTGFDIIYACQDAEFDASVNLHSVPAKWGVPRALRLAAAAHAVMLLLLVALPLADPRLGLRWIYGCALVVIAALLLWEHRLVRPNDLARVNTAFFQINAWISLLLLVAGGLDCYLG